MAWQHTCCGARPISPCAAQLAFLLIEVRNGARRAAVVRAGGGVGGIFGFAAAPARCNSPPHHQRRFCLSASSLRDSASAPRRQRPAHRRSGATVSGAKRSCSCAVRACQRNISRRGDSSHVRTQNLRVPSTHRPASRKRRSSVQPIPRLLHVTPGAPGRVSTCPSIPVFSFELPPGPKPRAFRLPQQPRESKVAQHRWQGQ